MKKGDYIIIAFVLILASFMYFSSNFTTKDYDQKIINISVNNQLYQTYDFSLETSESVNLVTEFGHNQIEINNGEVWISDADCHNKVCILDGNISIPGEILVCLPNKLIIEVEGTKITDVDEVAY